MNIKLIWSFDSIPSRTYEDDVEAANVAQAITTFQADAYKYAPRTIQRAFIEVDIKSARAYQDVLKNKDDPLVIPAGAGKTVMDEAPARGSDEHVESIKEKIAIPKFDRSKGQPS